MAEQNTKNYDNDIEAAQDCAYVPVKKLDYNLKTMEERVQFIKERLLKEEQQGTHLTRAQIETISDYIIEALDKKERKDHYILTNNRMVTVNKRETSFEGLVSKLENGEDGIYNMLENNKNVLLTPKISITPKDLKEIPELKTLCDAIDIAVKQMDKVSGKDRYLLKKQIIEMYRDQYVIKEAFRKPVMSTKVCNSPEKINFDENITINEDGTVSSDGLISLFDYKHISAILCNYSQLKQDSWGKFSGDMFYIMEDVDNLVEQTLHEKYPLYYDLVVYKIDGKTNIEIQQILEHDYGIKHSIEYISSLWRNKIPKLIADQAQENYLLWYYTFVERGKWKRCSRCGEVKLAHNRFFSKNGTSKDGLYSICKACRNAKNKKK